MFVVRDWDAEGRRVDPRDVAPAPVTAFARQQSPRYTAVLSATSTVLDERDQLELLREVTGCKATLDWLVCRTISSLAVKDTIHRREITESRAGAPLVPGGGEMMPLAGEGTPPVCEFLVPEVALELSCSERAARDLIAVSLDLRFRLPSTNATFGGGRLTLAHARVISGVTRCLSEDDALRLDERLAEAATTRTPGRLRVLARRWVARLCPDSFRRRQRAAVAQRSTTMFATQDGMAAFCLDHQLETLAVIDDQLDAWARQRRSLDPATAFAAHKADAAAHLLLGQHPVTGVALLTDARQPRTTDTDAADPGDPTTLGQSTSDGPTTPGDPPGLGDPAAPDGPTAPGDPRGLADPAAFLPARTELRVTMSGDGLLGLDDGTCELDGYGPITADQARRLVLTNCGSTTVRRVFTDPADDAVMFLDAQRYLFTTRQKEAVLALHPISCFPGATTPGTRCDIDHRRPYRHGRPHAAQGDEADDATSGEAAASGGRTIVSNGQPLGRRHHLMKTLGGWTAEADSGDPHTIIWTSPRGRVHVTRDHDGA